VSRIQNAVPRKFSVRCVLTFLIRTGPENVFGHFSVRPFNCEQNYEQPVENLNTAFLHRTDTKKLAHLT
jgi:hypothetical protein